MYNESIKLFHIEVELWGPNMPLFQHLIVKVMPIIPKPVVRLVSNRYVAGPELANAVKTVKVLNATGATATMDVLGESAQTLDESREAVAEYLRVLESIVSENLDCNISLKPTQLGLLLDKEACYHNIHTILTDARQRNIFVRVDMEDASCTSSTIELYKRLRAEFDNVGIVIQAYLRRSPADLDQLIPLGTNFRLCKGIYNEPRAIAWKTHKTVNDNFIHLIDKALSASCYVGIATHDEEIVCGGMHIIDRLGLKKDQYEFQMLLGVDEELRRIIINAGHTLRVYVPYGQKWYAYSMRRLKENPKIAGYIAKAVLTGFFKRKK